MTIVPIVAHVQQIKVVFRTNRCVVLTEPAPVTRHGHERAQAAADHALGPAQRRLLEGTRVLVQEGVDAVDRGRTAISYDGLCGQTQNISQCQSFP